MSDFSMFSLFAAGLACIVPLTAAYTTPVGDSPVGNPIYQPGLNSVVPAGNNFTITWDPTTKGTVTLVLLKGPSENAVPQYAIVEKTPNDGSYIWSVSEDLAPTADATGYGIQLIDDATGQYQYTTQFGISNDHYEEGSSSSSSSAAPKPTGYGSSSSSAAPHHTGKPAHYTTSWVKDYTTVCPEATTFSMNNKTYTVTEATTLTISDCSCTVTHSNTPPPVYTTPASVSIPKPHNVTMVGPTGYTPSTTLQTSAPVYSSPTAPNPSAPVNTGAASSLAGSVAGVVLAAGFAVFAL